MNFWWYAFLRRIEAWLWRCSEAPQERSRKGSGSTSVSHASPSFAYRFATCISSSVVCPMFGTWYVMVGTISARRPTAKCVWTVKTSALCVRKFLTQPAARSPRRCAHEHVFQPVVLAYTIQWQNHNGTITHQNYPCRGAWMPFSLAPISTTTVDALLRSL